MPVRQRTLSGRRRRLANDIRDRLRVVQGQLSLLNHAVSTRLELRDVDLDCLDLIQQHGPISPSQLASMAGLHPATLTGILDRLQRGGWALRERDPEAPDRRGVTVRMCPDRAGEVFQLYRGMLTALDEICAGYTAEQLELLAGFLDRLATAGHRATEDLTTDTGPPGPDPRVRA